MNFFTTNLLLYSVLILTLICLGMIVFLLRRLGKSLPRHEIPSPSCANTLTIINSMVDAVYSCNLEGIITSWNAGAEKIYEWPAAEILGQSISLLIPPEQIFHLEQLRKLFSEGKNLIHVETQAVKKTQEIIWVHTTYCMIRDKNQKTVGVSISAHDATCQRKSRESLQQSEEKFRAFIETTEEWVWEMDPVFRFTYSNPSVDKILGFSSQEMLGQEIFFLLPERMREQIKRNMQKFVEKRGGWTQQTEIWRHKNGTELCLESNGKPILDAAGELLGFRGTARDVTEKLKTEKVKNEFISLVSHELRNPLTSIHGALGLMKQEETIAEKEKDLISIAYRNSERLTQLINDVLTLEKLQSGRLEMEYKIIPLREVIEEAIQYSQPAAEKANILVMIEALIDVQIKGDANRLHEVMSNLLSNAIKYSSPQGKVFISMQILDDQVRVLVRDEGPGIPEEFRSKIFQRFARADSTTTREKEGTGLGLSICKNIIEHHGGKIDFESKEGEGTTFYFDLPINK